MNPEGSVYRLPRSLRSWLAKSQSSATAVTPHIPTTVIAPHVSEAKVTIAEARSKLCSNIEGLLVDIRRAVDALHSGPGLSKPDAAFLDQLLLRLSFWEDSAGLFNKPIQRPLVLPLLDAMIFYEAQESLAQFLDDVLNIPKGSSLRRLARGLAEAHKTRLMKTVHSLTSARLRSLIEVQRMIASWNIKDQSVDEHLRLLADEKSKYMSQVLPDGWHRVNKWTLCNRHDTDSLVGRLVSDVKAPSTSLYPLITAEHVTYTELSMRVLASSITELDMIIVIQQLLHPSDQLVPTRLLDTRRADDHAEVMPTIYFECKQIDSSSKQFLRQEQFQTLVERHQLGPSDSAHAILGTYTVAADLPLIGILEFIIGVDSVATGRSSRPTDNAARHVLLGPDRANVAESSMLSRDPSTLPESSLRLSDSDATTKPSSFGPTSETPSGLRDTQHGKAMDLFAIDQMRTTLQDELDRHQIGLDNERSYLPQRVVSIFTTAEAVRQVFPSLPKGLLQYIVVSIPKTYLITVLSFQTDSMILKALESFRKHSFKDEDLPVSKLTRKDSTRNCGRDWGTPRAAYVEDCHICEGTDPGLHSCSHPSPHFAFHHACWDRYTFDIFFDKQWAFLVQKFNPYDFLYTDLEYDRILPFKRPESRGEIGAGYFSDVQKVELVSEFLNPEIAETLNSEDGTTVSAALKTLKHVPEKQYQVENEWIREASAMKTLNFLRHAHITRGIAAFKHRERFYLLLEWADQTNLQEIWSQNPRPTLNNSSLISWLKQLLGLADALYHMHDTKRARDRRTSSLEPLSKQASKDHFDADQGLELSSSHPLRRSSTTEAQRGDSIPTIIISSDDDPMFSSSEEQGIRSSEGDHWRHGDINPRNIVSFASDDPSPGVLKLADFGRAKRHVAVTALRSTVEHDLWHTAKYEPPDLFVTGYRGAMSRLYDIWSLGCVYFETIIWMLYGLGEIHQMALTSAMHSEGSPYWSRHGPGRAKVSDLVSVWMSFILNNDPRCNAGSSALGDLMKVIREKMLVVELYSDTGAPSRAPAAIIVEELRRIVRRAEVDRKYIDVCLQHAKQVVLPPAFSVSVKHTSKHISQLDSSAAPLPPEAMEAPQVTHSTKYDYVHQDYHSPVSTWKTEDDIDFINHVISQDSPSLSINKERTAQRLCNVCQTLDLIGLQSRIPWRLSEYAKRLEREECVLCTIIHNVARRAGVMASHPVELNIDANGLMINGLATAVMRLCKPVLEPLTYANQSAGNKDALLYQRIQYGAPSLAALPNLGLVREWLNDCDGNHDCAKGLEQVYMPRRLLDVRTLKLVDTKGCEDPVRYMVLSFVWGSKDVFHTNKENLQSHYEGIFPDQLPTLFRDAIVIAKSLDIKYLMIDAICVVQNHHDEIQQYLRSGRDLYNSAYLTLAACSQRDVHGSMMSARFPTQYASIPASLEDEEAKIHVSDLTDDFDHDVLEAPLNRRAWVLEARAFSRRTVYFSEKQLYWECGIGVRCETLTRMNSFEASFLGDPKFPAKFLSSKTGSSTYFVLISRLYELYSTLESSSAQSRPLAIASFEQAFSRTLNCAHASGILDKLVQRWLLWERAPDEPSLQRINFGGTSVQQPPSWSWQAYKGRITYLQPPIGKVRWTNHTKFRLPGQKDESWLYADEGPTFEAEIARFKLSPVGSEGCAITFDRSETIEGSGFGLCVILGTLGDGISEASRHYVIVVRQSNSEDRRSAAVKAKFERIGVGYLSQRVMGPSDYTITGCIV